MASLVLDLQSDALSTDISLSELLRKALAVSRKLDIETVRRWIEFELDGYRNSNKADLEMAPYRKVFGTLKFYNPYQGLIFARFNDHRLSELCESAVLYESISELEDLLRSGKPHLQRGYDPNQSEILRDHFKTDFEPYLEIPRQQVVKILDSVKRKILDWSLELEAQGIKGDGMTFSKQEQQAAAIVQHNTVNNTTNNIGSMSHSQIQQHSSGGQNMANKDAVEQARMLVEALSESLAALKLSSAAENELRAEIDTIKAQVASPKPKVSVLKECLLSAKTILEGTAGNVLASGVALQIPAIVAALGG